MEFFTEDGKHKPITPKSGRKKSNGTGSTKSNGSKKIGKGIISSIGKWNDGIDYTKDSNIVDYYSAQLGWERFADKITLEGYSFDPVSNKGYDFDKSIDRMEFFNKFTINDTPVFVISLTNNMAEYTTRESHSNYIYAQECGYYPMLGKWFSRKYSSNFLDVTVPLSNISLEQAQEFAKDHAQEGFVEILNNGKIRYIDT